MKQLMVLVSTIILGLTISGTVIGFGTNVGTLKTGVDNAVTAIDTQLTNAVTAATPAK